jgi:hypothetical protein
MPAVLCFDTNPSETIAVLSEYGRYMRVATRGLRKYADQSKRRRGRRPWLPPFRSFESLRVVTPAAALVLAAEFERMWRLGGPKPFVANVHKWAPAVVDTLWEVGFFKIVGFPDSAPRPALGGDQVIVPMRSGMIADAPAVQQLLQDLRSLYPGQDDGRQAGLVHLYGAMVEAIVNVVRHAYPAQRAAYWGKPSRRWWMTGAVDRRERWTTAVVYDQGVTIPLTLPDWEQYAGWRQRFATMIGVAPAADDPRQDGNVIFVASEQSITSSGKAHHGNGLAQMRNFVDQCHQGHLRIVSRCGEVVFRPKMQPEIKTYDVPIRGTLIEWRVLLDHS